MTKQIAEYNFRGKKLKDLTVETTSFYPDGQEKLYIRTKEGEPFMEPTVCLIDYGLKPQPGNVFIKNYSECAGAAAELQKAGIVGPTICEITFGPFNTTVIECKLLMN